MSAYRLRGGGRRTRTRINQQTQQPRKISPMQSTKTHIRRGISALAFASAAMSYLQLADAAPNITRLTPPSANDPNPPYIARFLPGQRFDLQATISPDAGQTIVSVQFL